MGRIDDIRTRPSKINFLKSEAKNNKDEIHQKKIKLEYAPLLSERRKNLNMRTETQQTRPQSTKAWEERGRKGSIFKRGKETRMETENDKPFQYRPYLGQFSAGRDINVQNFDSKFKLGN